MLKIRWMVIGTNLERRCVDRRPYLFTNRSRVEDGSVPTNSVLPISLIVDWSSRGDVGHEYQECDQEGLAEEGHHGG